MRILGCAPGLIGWTMREVEPDPHYQHFHKAYGEILDNTNGREPGKGVTVAMGSARR